MTMRDGGFSHVALVAWLTLLSACSAGETTRPKGSSVGNVGHAPPSGSRCAPAGDAPTREGFYQEALFAEPTERTPRFDDYTPGSYHVNKLDLVRGLPARAKACGLPLEAVLVVGPVGLLWSFHVATLIAEGPNVRVNALVMPHARITGKGTGLASAAEASALLQRIQSAPLVRRGLPAPLPVDLEKDFAYRLLLAVYDTAPPQYFHAEFIEFTSDPKRDELMDRVNALFGTTKAQTYPPGEREH